jgi:murein L,D-transpeptidase YcbB/YkuD
MHSKLIIILAAALALVACNHPTTVDTAPVEHDYQADVNDQFKKTWKSLNKKKVEIQNIELEASEELNDFYSNRALKTIWTNNLKPNEHALAVSDLISNAHLYGLDTLDYRIAQIQALQQEIELAKNDQKLAAIVNYELLLSNETFVFMSHLNQGTLNKDSLWKESKLDQVSLDLAKTLESGVQNTDIAAAVLEAQPSIYEYDMLQQGLVEFLANYELVAETFYLKDPKKDSALSYDKAQDILVAYGFLTDSLSEVDSCFDVALKAFQTHTGLKADGKIGKNTRKALMESNMGRYQRLVASMQRLRWESDTSSTYIRVNIPTYQLKIVNANKVERAFNVVVGSPWTPTPTFDSRMTHFITNPQWYVPYSISTGEIMPKAKKDSTYLARNGYKVFNGRKQVASSDIDWGKVSQGKYKIRQNQGRGNALGLIKFIFPNKHSVYLHDTNQKRFFKKDVRAYSHGCMRLQDPFDFADYLVLHDQHEIVPDTIDSLIVRRKRKTINLNQPLDVHVVYVTVSADLNGDVHFFHDVYGKDEALVAALFSTTSSTTDK